MSMHRSHEARIVVEPLDAAPAPEAALVIFCAAPAPAVLESSLFNERYGQVSIFACEPVEVVEPAPGGCPLDALQRRMAEYPRVRSRPSGPVPACGWIGYVAYEAGLATEGVSPNPHGLFQPLARFGLYDAMAVFDHVEGRWYASVVDWPEPFRSRRPSVEARLNRLQRRLESAEGLFLAEPTPPGSTALRTNMSRDEYLARVSRAKRYIKAGDIYQVNLTQRFAARTSTPPLDLYRRVRGLSPSSHAAFLQWGQTAVICASPELFLKLRDDHVITRPIKGTRPRTGDPLRDAVARSELKRSEKEHAELNMIVDLLRNDLGRECAFGSVRVHDAGMIEEHPTVYHRTATIEGALARGRDRFDLLRACFPGGSVTGAPKIRAVQIIRELEPTARGVYCGSIGRLGLDGSMSLNIAIRTMVQRRDRVYAYAGGAIVADSDPIAEYEETMAKAAAMLRALGAHAPDESLPVGARSENDNRFTVVEAAAS